MAKTETSPLKIAIGVCLGFVGGTVLLRSCDAAMEQARIDQVNEGFRDIVRQAEQARQDTLREQLRQKAEDDAATARIRAKVAAELARRASEANR